MRGMKVIFTSHRVENLQFMKSEFEKAKVIVLEEPRNEVFQEVLKGNISVEAYVNLIDTQFPVYTSKLIQMLKELGNKDILQIEPYLEEVERLSRYNTGDERVRDMERKVNLAYLDYVESFMRGDFDEIVSKVIDFAKADAQRFVMRDEMRAKSILELEEENMVIEAGVMHSKLAEILNAETVSIPELIAERLNIKYIENPGNVLTKSFIYDFDCDRELLAARSLIYVTLTKKEEIVPESDSFPHFTHEQKLVRFVNNLSYERCKKVFFKLWKFEKGI